MKAVEFNTALKDNQIRTPDEAQSELKYSQNKSIRVIVLIEESDDTNGGDAFRQLAKEQFLKGYDASDSVYDD